MQISWRRCSPCPSGLNQTFKELLFYLESLTVSISFLEYLGISPCVERYSQHSPGKDATVFVGRVLLSLFHHFYGSVEDADLSGFSMSENCFCWAMGMFLSYVKINHIFWSTQILVQTCRPPLTVVSMQIIFVHWFLPWIFLLCFVLFCFWHFIPIFPLPIYLLYCVHFCQ